VSGKSCFVATLNVLLLPIATQGYAWELVASLAKFTHQVMAATIRQAQIAQEQVEGLLIGQLNSRRHISRHFNRVAFCGQHLLHHLGRDTMILNQQDTQGPNGPLRSSDGRRYFRVAPVWGRPPIRTTA
jgi:hypothetical protein